MDFFSKIILFFIPVVVWYYVIFAELYKSNGRKEAITKVQTLMQKILYIVAKGRKKETSANEDFLNNMNREPDAEVVETEPVQQELPMEEIEHLPSTPPESEYVSVEKEVVPQNSDPKPSEPPRDQVADVVIKMEFPDLNNQASMTALDKLNTLLATITSLSDNMQTLNERVNNMALNLELLTAEVERAKTVHSSTIGLLTKVVGELETVKADLAAKLAHIEPPVDTSALDTLTADLKASTDALAAAVASSSDVIATHTVVLHAEDPTTPTVEVILPEVLPEVVTTTVEQIVETVDPASTEPQIQIVVEAAPAEVVAAVEAAPAEVVADPVQDLTLSTGETIETGVIETDEGQVDVTVAVPAEEAAVAEAAGVDVVEAVTEAFEAAPEVVAEPAPAVEAPLDAAGIPGAEGTQSGETAEKPVE